MSRGDRDGIARRPEFEALEPRLLLSSTPAFSQMMVFGDSLSDTGNDAAWAWWEGFHTNDGRFTSSPSSDPPTSFTDVPGVWHEFLADQLGIPRATPSHDSVFSGGTNWAYGGATTDTGTQSWGIVVNVGEQVSDFISQTSTHPADALYVIWAGGNDLLNAADEGLTDHATFEAIARNAVHQDPQHHDLEDYIQSLITNEGATYILWPNLPALDETPHAKGDPNNYDFPFYMDPGYSQPVNAALKDAVDTFNSEWVTAAQELRNRNPNVTIWGLDAHGLFDEMLTGTYPGYQFTHVSGEAEWAKPTPASADGYIFWDGLHPTEKAHSLLGYEAFDLITGMTGADQHERNNQSWAWVATPITLDAGGHGSVSGSAVYPANDLDWYKFTAPFGITGGVQITLSNVTYGLTGRVTLYDSSLGTLSDLYGGVFTTLYGSKAQAGAGGPNQSVTLNGSGLMPGETYYVKISGLNGTTGFYDLSITAGMLIPDAFEPNNTSGAAANITMPLIAGNGTWSQSNLNIQSNTDEDWYRIDTPANTDGNLTARVSNVTAGLQGIVWVYQQYSWGRGAVALGVYASWMPGGAGQAVVYNAQPNRTYFVGVDSFWRETGGYRLDVTLPLDAQVKDAYEAGAGNNASWLAAPLTLNSNAVTVTNLTIHSSADQDWFRFMTSANGTVQATVSGVSAGLLAHVGLYDSAAGTLSDLYGGIYTTYYGPKQEANATNLNDAVTLNFSGLHAWTTYYVKVSGSSNTTGLYTLGVQFTPVGGVGSSDDILQPAMGLLA